MKTFKTGLLKGRITRRSLLTAVLPTAGLSLAWARGEQDQSLAKGHIQLGGAWIGTQESGHAFSQVQIPLGPEGNTAAIRMILLNYGQSVANLLAAFKANQVSDWVGPARMISRNTAKATFVGYLQALGTVLDIKAIVVINALFQFTDADTFLGNYTNSVYLPSADFLPHGDPVVGPLIGETLTWKRVPLL